MTEEYIEQLLERYWAAETTPHEEGVLRAYFAQESVPERFCPFKPLFDYEAVERNVGLGSDFDERLMNRIGQSAQPSSQAPRLTWRQRLQPLFSAAAVVAAAVFIVNVAQYIFQNDETPTWDYNSTNYTDTYADPETAFTETMETLQFVGDAVKTAAASDSLVKETIIEKDAD